MTQKPYVSPASPEPDRKPTPPATGGYHSPATPTRPSPAPLPTTPTSGGYTSPVDRGDSDVGNSTGPGVYQSPKPSVRYTPSPAPKPTPRPTPAPAVAPHYEDILQQQRREKAMQELKRLRWEQAVPPEQVLSDSERCWFEQFALNYEDRVEAAIEYFNIP